LQRNLDVVCAVADQHDVLQSIAVEIAVNKNDFFIAESLNLGV
jgi:hypothetical protein